jgi:hypothetical protein
MESTTQEARQGREKQRYESVPSLQNSGAMLDSQTRRKDRLVMLKALDALEALV